MYNLVKMLNHRQALVSKNGTFFVASESAPSEFLPGLVPLETLVFPANAEGQITDWFEVDGERGMTLERFLHLNVIA